MIKPNQTSSANVNVLAESDLTQVVGGCGYRRNNYRWRHHHGWGWRHRDYGHEGGFQSQGPDDSFDGGGSDFEGPSTSSSSSDDTTDATTPV